MEGDEVVELAVLPVTKGEALIRLRHDIEVRRHRRVAVLYAGDDVTDETAFARLKLPDVGIKVGHAPTVASFRVADPPAMAAALQFFVRQVRRN